MRSGMFSDKESKNKKYLQDYLALLNLTQQPPSVEYLFEILEAHRNTIPYDGSNLVLHQASAVNFKKSQMLQHFQKGGGGICYQIHGCLNKLLTLLGFETTLCSARVHRIGARVVNSTEDTHCVIVVRINNNEYLLDATFGNGMRLPINIGGNTVTMPGELEKRCIIIDDKYALQAKVDGAWYTEYNFNLKNYKIKEFSPCLDYLTSPAHFLSTNLLLARYKPEFGFERGIIPIYEDAEHHFKFFRTSHDGVQTEIEIKNKEELAVKMKEYGVPQDNQNKILGIIKP